MAPRKPASLITRHDTAAERAERERRESLVKPARELPMTPPALLDDHPIAQAAWRKLMREFQGIEGKIVSRLDMAMLVDYCLAVEQLAEVDRMRKTAFGLYEQVTRLYDKMLLAGNEEHAANLIPKITLAFDSTVKLDSRADRKRDLLFRMRQNMYMTPRARAGMAPASKKQEPEKDEFEQLLDDITESLNDGRDK